MGLKQRNLVGIFIRTTCLGTFFTVIDFVGAIWRPVIYTITYGTARGFTFVIKRISTMFFLFLILKFMLDRFMFVVISPYTTSVKGIMSRITFIRIAAMKSRFSFPLNWQCFNVRTNNVSKYLQLHFILSYLSSGMVAFASCSCCWLKLATSKHSTPKHL